MFAALLIGTGAWYSTRCFLNWKLKGTKLSRFYFLLQASTRLTKEIESGLLPTPKAMEAEEDYDKWKDRMVASGNPKNVGKTIPNLGTMARSGLLPTPRAWDGDGGGARPVAEDGRTTYGKDSATLKDLAKAGLLPTPTCQDADKATKRMREDRQNNLTAVVFNGLIPTPASRDYKGASSTEALAARGRLKEVADCLSDQFAVPGKTSHLNPRFVAEMMGYPVDWLELPFQDTAGNHSRDTATPSSPR